MCSLFGLIDYGKSLSAKQKNKIISALATACEERGTDASGIAYNSRKRLHIYKRPLAAHLMRWHIPDDATVIMGHTRLTTQGNAKHNYNNHPFYGSADKLFALAHNGMLHNDKLLRAEFALPKPKIETDSFVAVQLIEQQHNLDFTSLAFMAEQLEGSFAFTVLDENDNLYFVKGDNPLCIYNYPKLGLYLYASLESLLSKALKMLPYNLGQPERIDLICGEIMCIDKQGNMSGVQFNTEKLFGGFNYWSDWGFYRYPLAEQSAYKKQYIEELKAAAPGYGITADDIDDWLAQGYFAEEIEEMLYYSRI